MAATFVQVTLDDMDRFIKRAYRALKPRQGTGRGEIYYDLNLSDEKIFIRVWTSVKPRSGQGAGAGQDAIRVTMVTKGGKPLVPKGKIVKRTKNWRGNLQDRIEGLLEDYEAKTGYWKGRQQDRDGDRPEHDPDHSQTFIEDVPEPEEPPSQEHSGQWAKDRGGTWRAKIFSKAQPGDEAVLVRRTGQSLRVILQDRIWAGKDRFSGKYSEMWTHEARGGGSGSSRYASAEEITTALVAETILARAEVGTGQA